MFSGRHVVEAEHVKSAENDAPQETDVVVVSRAPMPGSSKRSKSAGIQSTRALAVNRRQQIARMDERRSLLLGSMKDIMHGLGD